MMYYVMLSKRLLNNPQTKSKMNIDGIVIEGILHQVKDNISCKECSIKDTKYCRNFGKICSYYSNRGFVKIGYININSKQKK